MCGRYASYQRPAEVRRQLEQAHMPSEEAPADHDVRLTYNFAPGNHGLVYRANVPDGGAPDADAPAKHTYKLQAMKWGLVPSWTKRAPDYVSMLKTINCRDDSLLENRGLWNSMKHHKRCIVVCQGFYEWLKKSGGKERIPHFVKRKDGQLMCFAGLWDCVRFEGSEETLYSYTIITTGSNQQLKFLHDRMPVILDNGSAALRAWLDPGRREWDMELQSLLEPYAGELECYAVSKDVGKVGNDSASFIVPVDSKENKANIANFFDKQKETGKGKKAAGLKTEEGEEGEKGEKGGKIEDEGGEHGEARGTSDQHGTALSPDSGRKRGVKRGHAKGEGGSPHRSNKASRTSRTSRTSKADGSQKITAFFGK